MLYLTYKLISEYFHSDSLHNFARQKFQTLLKKRIQKHIIAAAKKLKKSIFASSIHEKKVTQKNVKPENVIYDLPEYLQNKPNPEKVLFSPARAASILASNQYIYYLSWNTGSLTFTTSLK